MQKEGYRGLTDLGREKPCKKNGGKRQKQNGLEPWTSRIEREKLKNFLKKWVWNCQTRVLKNFVHDFRLIEK